MLKEGHAAKSSFYTWGGGLALFLLVLIPRALNLGLFLTPDEPRWMDRSIEFLRAILEKDWGATFPAVEPGMATPGGVPTKWAGLTGILIRYLGHRLGFGPSMDPPPIGGVDLEGFLTWLGARPQNLLDILVSVRLPIVLLTSLGVVMVYILARKLFNNKVAWLGAALLALDPFYLAHSRLLHTDALTTLFMTLSVLSFIVYLDTEKYQGLFGGKREKSSLSLLPWPVLFSGVMSGLAFTTKSGALFLIPLVASWTILAYLLRCRSQGQVHLGQAFRLALILVVWGGIGGGASILVWPAMWVDPLGTLQRLFTHSRYLVEAGQTQFFLGQVVNDPGPGFYPLVLLFRTTPLTLLGVVVGIILAKVDQEERAWRQPVFWLGSYIILFTAFLSLSPKKNDRYLLPLFPAIEILAGMGLWKLVGWVRQRASASSMDWPSKAAYLIPVGCLALQAAFVLPHHPYYLTYFNPAAGGMRTAPSALLVGWGEGLEQAARYLNGQEGARRGRVLAWYAALGFNTLYQEECRELSPQRQPAGDVWPWYEADYVVFYVNQVQRNLPDEKMVAFFRSQEPEHIVRLKGRDYAWVYKVPEEVHMDAWPFQHPLAVDFGGVVRLLGYDLGEPFSKGEGRWSLPLTLYWQNKGPMDGNYRLYLKLINGVYHIWGGEEGYPLWDGFMTSKWKEGVVIRDEREISILPGTPPGIYQVTVHWLEPYSGWSLPFEGGGELLLGPVEVSRSQPPAAEFLDIEHRLEANLSHKFRLLGFALEGSSVRLRLNAEGPKGYNLESGFRPGDSLHLTLFWQALAEVDRDYTVFTHLVDRKGKIWGQKDNQPVDGFYPTSLWVRGEIVRDQYDLPIAPDIPSGEYELEVGMYLAETGQRLTIVPDKEPEAEKATETEISLAIISIRAE